MDYQNNKFLHKNVFKFMSMFVELSNKLQPFIYYLAEFIRAASCRTTQPLLYIPQFNEREADLYPL